MLLIGTSAAGLSGVLTRVTPMTALGDFDAYFRSIATGLLAKLKV